MIINNVDNSLKQLLSTSLQPLRTSTFMYKVKIQTDNTYSNNNYRDKLIHKIQSYADNNYWWVNICYFLDDTPAESASNLSNSPLKTCMYPTTHRLRGAYLERVVAPADHQAFWICYWTVRTHFRWARRCLPAIFRSKSARKNCQREQQVRKACHGRGGLPEVDSTYRCRAAGIFWIWHTHRNKPPTSHRRLLE